MKFAVSTLLALIPAAGAFAPTSIPAFGTCLSAAAEVETGPKGKAAGSKQEDLDLTLQIILDHASRSTTVSKEQFIQQMAEVKQKDEEPETFDLSIPYDAAAKLAFEASDKSMDFADFKVKYEEDAVALVTSKKPVDISVPYDAAAVNAFKASDRSTPYAEFKAKYEADAVAEVIAKQPVDISVPYDATAKLAYAASDKLVAYPAFKEQFFAAAVADIIAKQPVDISVPYDAAAMNAYKASDRSAPYAEFKKKFEADAVAEVVAKQQK
mmetsp:Transcript_1285/g.1711  ORF Transcript_1285/g.1711 Transcript_1285/m.1711 type:complete len:268 (+) Transcript_1285:68-871(+)